MKKRKWNARRVSDRIAELRGDLTLDAISRDVGVNVSQWHRWEHGVCPHARYLFLLAQAFDVSVDWILGLED